jgi:hypothetical protein
LDERGRTRVLAACMAVFKSLLEEQADAKVRLGASGEKPMEATVGMAALIPRESDATDRGYSCPSLLEMRKGKTPISRFASPGC